MEAVLRQVGPWAVINTTGYVRVDQAESENEACRRENFFAATNVARACAALDIPCVNFSSDLVFDGAKGRPYVEGDPTSPLNCYGRCKAEAETAILELSPRALVVRTSAFFGPWDEYNFVHHVRRTLASGEVLFAQPDEVISPTYVPHLAHTTLDLLIDGEAGVWHLANRGALSWADFARIIAAMNDLDVQLVIDRTSSEMQLPAIRPAYSALTSERGLVMPTLEEGLKRYALESTLAYSK